MSFKTCNWSPTCNRPIAILCNYIAQMKCYILRQANFTLLKFMGKNNVIWAYWNQCIELHIFNGIEFLFKILASSFIIQPQYAWNTKPINSLNLTGMNDVVLKQILSCVMNMCCSGSCNRRLLKIMFCRHWCRHQRFISSSYLSLTGLQFNLSILKCCIWL